MTRVNQWPNLARLRWWSIRGLFRRTLRLTRNPRYAVGLLAAVAYFYWFVLRHVFQDGDMPVVNLGIAFSESVHLMVAGVLGLYVGISWLATRRQGTIKIKSADFHLLMPAPIHRRTLLSYSLLQQIPKLLLVALILGLIMSTSGNPIERLRHTATLMLFFVSWDMYSKCRGVLQQSLWRITPAAWLASQALAAGMVLGILAAARRGIVDLAHNLSQGDPSTQAFWSRATEDLSAAILSSDWAWVLKPFTFLTAGRFSDSPGEAALSILGGLALTVILFALLVWANPGFNESQVVSAIGKRDRREERLNRRSPRMRRNQPFPLAPGGRPEPALWWKHMLAATRLPLSWMLGMFGLAAAIIVAIVVLTGAPQPIVGVFMAICAVVAVALPFFAGISGNSGFVRDLKHLEAVRTWPVAPRNMALGQSLQSALVALGGTVLLFALIFATHLAVRAAGFGAGSDPAPIRFLEEFGADPSVALALLLISALPGLTGIAFLSSQLEGVTGLFLPGWLMMGERRRGDPAAFGTRIIYSIAFFLALAFAFLPTGLMVFGLALLIHGGWTPSIWLYPPLGLILAAPLLAEATGLTYLGGRLWRGLDPSQEVLEGFE